MSDGLSNITSELEKRLDTQELLLLCGELGKNEILTAKALIKWMLRLCEKHNMPISQVSGAPVAGMTSEMALKEALGAVNRARQAYPDSQSSQALRTVESELRVRFSEKNVAKNKVDKDHYAQLQP
jgi:hypothetical protein